MSRDLCYVFLYLPPTPLRQGNHSFALFFIFESFLHPIIVYSRLPSLSFFLKVMNTFLMGILQGLHGKTSLVLGSVSKQCSPPTPTTTTLFPQERMHHEASMGWASKDLTAQAILYESHNIALGMAASSRCAVKDPGKSADFHGAELLSQIVGNFGSLFT